MIIGSDDGALVTGAADGFGRSDVVVLVFVLLLEDLDGPNLSSTD
jgi:hypothetical protein